MKNYILLSLALISLAGCAQTPQQAAAMQALGRDLLADGVIGGRGAPGAVETSCRPNIFGGMDCVSN